MILFVPSNGRIIKTENSRHISSKSGVFVSVNTILLTCQSCIYTIVIVFVEPACGERDIVATICNFG